MDKGCTCIASSSMYITFALILVFHHIQYYHMNVNHLSFLIPTVDLTENTRHSANIAVELLHVIQIIPKYVHIFNHMGTFECLKLQCYSINNVSATVYCDTDKESNHADWYVSGLTLRDAWLLEHVFKWVVYLLKGGPFTGVPLPTLTHQLIYLWWATRWAFHTISFLQHMIDICEVYSWIWWHSICSYLP